MKLKILLLVCVTLVEDAYGECPLGFMHFEENCYAVLPIKVTWPEALRVCQAFQAKLAWIDSDLEQTFITGMLSRNHDSIATKEVWLAGTDMLVEGMWVWANTLKPLKYKNFFPGEPNNGGHLQHCLGMFRDHGFKWDDYVCSQKLVPLCKASANIGGEQIIG